MRIVAAVAGSMLVVVGATAAITGRFMDHAPWLLALSFAAIGLSGLVAAATTVSGLSVGPGT